MRSGGCMSWFSGVLVAVACSALVAGSTEQGMGRGVVGPDWLLRASAVTGRCKFCGTDAAHKAHTFDLSTLPNGSFTLNDARGSGTYQVASPCGCAAVGVTARGMKCTCMTQGTMRGLGDIDAEVTVAVGSGGFNVTVAGGDNDPPMPSGRNAVYHFVCDKDVPPSHQPDPTVTEQPAGFYNVIWRHPSACTSSPAPTTCPPPPPIPPLPPPPPPPPPPIPCAGGSECLPSWKPTWHMKNSTVLYTCNNSGMHDVHHANQFGIVSLLAPELAPTRQHSLSHESICPVSFRSSTTGPTPKLSGQTPIR